MSKRAELAEKFTILDIFKVNGALAFASQDEKDAWARVRSKLAVAANIQPPALVICNENGDIIPGAVANPKR